MILKVAYFYRYLILGGVSTQLANRLKYLREYITPYFGYVEEHGGRTVFGDWPHVYVLPDEKKQYEFIKENNFDAAIVIDTPEVYTPLSKANYQGTVINEVHTTTSNLPYLDNLRSDPEMVKRLSAMIAPSDYLVDRIKGEFGFDGIMPVYSVSNCLDMSKFAFDPTTPKPQKPIVLWVGKLDEHKNWKGFLEVAALLTKKGVDCDFWLAGGQTAPEKVVAQLYSKICELSLSDRVRWLCQVDYDYMNRLYSMVSESGGCMLVTSINESFGMSVAEAMACKCPVVVSKVGALPDLVEHGVNGFLYNLDFLGEAVELVQEVTQNNRLRQDFIENSYTKVKENCALEIVGEKYLRLLEKLCSR
jgi:glycosyltransferase involved in cell wall biosynthesis